MDKLYHMSICLVFPNNVPCGLTIKYFQGKKYNFETMPINYIVWKMGLISNFGQISLAPQVYLSLKKVFKAYEPVCYMCLNKYF